MADVDHLFDLPLDRFVAGRDTLARELKKAGDGGAAADVKALRKPTLSAWAVNQAVRQDPELADDLLDAAAVLREAQRQAMAGDEATDLREATRRHRAIVVELAKAAAALARGGGSVAERITSTIRATAASEAAAEAVRAGMLTADLDPSGFGDVSGLEAVSAPAERPRKAATAAAPTKQRRVPGARSPSNETAAETATPRRTGAGTEGQKERRAAADAARAAELEEEAERAETEASLAEAEHDRLEEIAADAEVVAKAARTEASGASRAAAEARTAADGAKRRAAKAREKADR